MLKLLTALSLIMTNFVSMESKSKSDLQSFFDIPYHKPTNTTQPTANPSQFTMGPQVSGRDSVKSDKFFFNIPYHRPMNTTQPTANPSQFTMGPQVSGRDPVKSDKSFFDVPSNRPMNTMQSKTNLSQSKMSTMNNTQSKISQLDMKTEHSLMEEIRLKTMEFTLPQMNFPLISEFLLQRGINVIHPGLVKNLADKLFQSIPDFKVNVSQNLQWTRDNKILELLLECVIFLMINITNLSDIFPFIDLNVYSLNAFVYNRFQNDFMAIQAVFNEIFLWDETLTFLINNNYLSNFKNSLLKRDPSKLPLHSQETMEDILLKEKYCTTSNCIFYLRLINKNNPLQTLKMNFSMKPYNFFQVTLEVAQKIEPKILSKKPMN